MIDFQIKPESGVSVERSGTVKGRGRPMTPAIKAHVERFAAMTPGSSFFVEGAQSQDLEFLRKPFTRAGLGVLIRRVERDEVHKKPGVRVWRLAGSYDEL